MDKSNYMPRLIDSRIESYLSASGALCIEGAKWCGKTRHKNQQLRAVSNHLFGAAVLVFYGNAPVSTTCLPLICLKTCKNLLEIA